MAVKSEQIIRPDDVASVILNQRKKCGLNREQLATLAGVGRTAIYDIEHGKTTYQMDTILKILRVLNLRLEINGIIQGDEK